MNIQTK